MTDRNELQKLTVVVNRNIKEKSYWLNQLAGSPVKTSIPSDNGKTGTNERRFGTTPFKLEGKLFSRLMEISGGTDNALFVILMTGLVVLLRKYTDSNDILVGVPIYRQDIEGEFINTILPIRSRIKDRMTFKELLMQLSQTFLEANKYQNYPVETLVHQLNYRDFSPGDDFPLFDTTVLLETIHDKRYLGNIHTNVNISFKGASGYMEGLLEYNSVLYRETTATRMVAHYINILTEAIFNVDRELSALNMLSREEEERLLVEFNDTDLDYSRDKTIGQLFEMQVEKTPDRIAVFGGVPGVAMTYGELNRKVDQLANLLRRKGVKPGVIVGIMETPSVDMAIEIMATLKAGGAYLPIDPDTPENRILHILEDCRASLLLTKTPHLREHSFTALQGLRDVNLHPYVTSPRGPVTHLDALPLPDRSLVDYDKYTQKISLAMVKNCISIQGTRGCPYECAYCAKLWSKKHMVRSAENIFQEVKLYYDIGVRRFSFIDDIFNLDMKNSRRFFQLIVDNKLEVQILFPAGLRGDILTRDYIDLMVEAGTIHISFALETASLRLQRLTGKNLNIEKLRENLQYLCQQYPHVILDLFTMHGFPSETEEEAGQTLDFIKSFKWLHFPLINILKIYPHTRMEKLALDNGITREALRKSENLPWHEFSDTLPFSKNFTLKYQADFLNDYFLLKERLLHVLPYQMKVLTKDEMVQKYNSYLPTEIKDFAGLLEFTGITPDELGIGRCRDEEDFRVPNLNRRIKACFPARTPAKNALRVLLLDLSLSFSRDRQLLDDLVEPPLGLLYLLTHLKEQLGASIHGKTAKSGVDFDSYAGLKDILSQFKPDVIGIRTLAFYKDFFHRTAAMIRQWGFNGPIIAGGPYATNSYTTMLGDRNIDAAVLSEGELTFSHLVREIIKNEGKLPVQEVLTKIPGIVFHPAGARGQNSRDIILLDEMVELLAAEPEENPVPLNQPGDLAYIIFTSGSTGKPRGVMVEHRNVNNLVCGLRERIYKGYEQGNNHLNVCLVAPYVFDASVQQVFAALLIGHSLYILPADTRGNGKGLLEFYKKHGIDISDGTPIHMSLMLEGIKGFKGGGRRQSLPAVKHFIIGGESLPWKLVERFFNAFGALGEKTPKITNIYGTAECCVDTTACEITRDNLSSFQYIPIGKPLANSRVYIVGKENQLQPVGIPGELFIGGDGVGRGYFGKETLTAEKFITNPFENNGRLYRTGDLARWLPDGNIDFLGRMDHQVKIRGFRIELGEIENLLLNHEDIHIHEAVVMVRDSNGESTSGYGNYEKALCAYIVSDKEFKTSQLREYLAQEIPDYMIPTYFVRLAAFPLTVNGKVDRKALPRPEIKPGDDFSAPANELEMGLAAIWAEVLGVDKDILGRDANFFELGGHSLKATILVGKIHKTFNVNLPLAEVFRSPTIRGMGQYMKTAEMEMYTSIEPLEEKEYYDLSYHQKRLWVIHQLESRRLPYNVPGVIPMAHNVDIDALKKTLAHMIERHEGFRTGFKEVNGQPVQMVVKNVNIPFRVVDLSYMDPEEKQRKRDRLVKEETETPFGLDTVPLFRSTLIKLVDRCWELVYNMHHIISDGWSMEILKEEFSRLYEGYSSNKTAACQPLLVQYKDFTAWHLEKLSNPVLKEKSHAFWRKKLEQGMDRFELPVDFENNKGERQGAAYNFVIANEVKDNLKQLARNNNTTLFTVMFAAYNILMARFSGQKDVVCSIINAGREHDLLHPVVGYFINSIPFLTHVDDEETFIDFLQRVKNDILEAFQCQSYPFELVLEDLNLKHPYVPVALNMTNMNNMTEVEIDSLESWHIDHGPAYFDIVSYAAECKNGILLSVSYNKKLLKASTIQSIANAYQQLLAYIVEGVKSGDEK